MPRPLRRNQIAPEHHRDLQTDLLAHNRPGQRFPRIGGERNTQPALPGNQRPKERIVDEALFELPPVVGKWSGSTNGVGTMGLGVPTIGFGPGEEESAHTGNERVAIRHLVKAAQFYASFPLTYVETTRRRS